MTLPFDGESAESAQHPTVKPSAGAQGSRGAAPGVPTAPLDLSQLLLQTLEAGR